MHSSLSESGSSSETLWPSVKNRVARTCALLWSAASRGVATRMTTRGEIACNAQPQAVEDPYARRWRDLRRAKARAAYAITVCTMVSVVGAWLLPSIITRCGVVMLAVVLAAPFVLKFGAFPCPRCKEPFVRRTDRENADYLAKKCVHCGLVIGTSKADAHPAPSEPKIRILMGG